jgi:hypothetical protein
MSKPLKEAIIEALECPFGGILVYDGRGYEVEELPEGAALIIPPNKQMPVAITKQGDDEVANLVKQFVNGRLSRATGKKIKRRVTNG